MKKFLCEASDHYELTHSDRVIRSPHDQVIVSLDFMRGDNQVRIHRVSLDQARTTRGTKIGPSRLCKPCADDWYKKLSAKRTLGVQGSLM